MTVPVNYPRAGFGAVPVEFPGACGVAAPGGDVPEGPGLSSADSSTPRGQPGASEVEPNVHGVYPPTLRLASSHRAPKPVVAARSTSLLRDMEDVPHTAIDTELRLLQFG